MSFVEAETQRKTYAFRCYQGENVNFVLKSIFTGEYDDDNIPEVDTDLRMEAPYSSSPIDIKDRRQITEVIGEMIVDYCATNCGDSCHLRKLKPQE